MADSSEIAPAKSTGEGGVYRFVLEAQVLPYDEAAPTETKHIEDLATYAAFAEIFGAVAIIGGALYALVQFSELRKRRRHQAAAALCREFTNPEFARAITLLRSLPDGISLRELESLDPKYQDAAQILSMSFETMGLLVYRDIASFQIVHELTGGLLLMMWRKIENWIKDTRVDQGNPRFAEWVQWLVERVEESESDTKPAFEAHANWKRRNG